MADKIRPERVTRGDLARDFRVDYLKLAPSRDFETSSRAVKKTIGSHFKCNLTENNNEEHKFYPCGQRFARYAPGFFVFLVRRAL